MGTDVKAAWAKLGPLVSAKFEEAALRVRSKATWILDDRDTVIQHEPKTWDEFRSKRNNWSAHLPVTG